MKCRKLFFMVACFVLVFSVSGNAFADTHYVWDPTIPYSAQIYRASTCHYGFTTSRYLTEPLGGFRSVVYVSNDSILWDDYSDIDFYEFVKPKDQNGNYLKSSWGIVYSGWYGDINSSIITMSPGSNTTRVYLRIENPGYTTNTINWNTGKVIGNMETNGKFWV